MVTLITNKLKNQSLEDLPSEPLKMVTISNRKQESYLTESERDISYQFSQDRRQGLGHNRTWSYPSHNLRRLSVRGTRLESFVMQASAATTSTSLPPASKKLCRSLSVPAEETVELQEQAHWIPRASNVWQPVKGMSRKRTDNIPNNAKPSRVGPQVGLLPSPAGVTLISTPPASPTPRPASAFAVLDEGSTKNYNWNMDACVLKTPKRGAKTNAKALDIVCPRLQRSRSQPSFEPARSCGIKRRIEDDFETGNKLRPALDLAKMEESSYFRCKDKRRGLRIPKYSNKRESRSAGSTYFTEQERFILKPIASSPLDAKVSSVMITPTSSPTKQLESEPAASILNVRKKSLENCNTADEGVYHLDYNSDLDIASIEEDN
ncbi:predicted protein [Nematostella vectensis]|uniref:Uncharacterized protein n=1 Tax=Nematostella vectensis TaxID=45351 RepID=A7S7K6_NEMVE|nr:predicted protein [Nematostella vectensis]|eukprot:XP_001632413.1 predicted protein [Nematostella vectensis]